MRLIFLLAAIPSSLFGAIHYSYSGSGIRPSVTSSYIGDRYDYKFAKIVNDIAGNAYATGSRYIPAAGSVNGIYTTDVFVTKVDPSGKLAFTATFSGKGGDAGLGIALDPVGNIYVVGSTSSPNFPLRGPIQNTNLGTTGFLLKLSPDGSQILASTFIGGTNRASANAVAVDALGYIYVAGTTAASDFPASPGLNYVHPSFGVPIVYAAFVAKLAPAVDRIVYSGLIGGNAVACGGGSSCFLSGRGASPVGIAVDSSGSAIIAGNANVTDLPVTQGAMRTQGIGAFAAKIKPDGSGLAFLTYIGARNDSLGSFSSPANSVSALALDTAGNPVIAGSTYDENFPATAGVIQPVYSGPVVVSPGNSQTDAFVAKLKSDGSRMIWATYLGGKSADLANALALDSKGNVWVTGDTQSPEFPNANGWTAGRDFVVELNPNASDLLYSARFPEGSASQSVGVDGRDLATVAGINGLISAVDPSAPVLPRVFGVANSFARTLGGRVAPQEILSLYGPHIGPVTPASFALDAAGNVPATLAGVQVLFDGVAAPLLYVSDTQINLIVPKAVQSKPSVGIRVVSGGATTPDFTALVSPTRPEIVQSPDGGAIALNQDGTINSTTQPAKAGTVVTIWAGGTGATTASDGAVATAAAFEYCCQAWVNGDHVDTIYSGLSPGLIAAATQINFRLPVTLAGTQVEIQISAGAGMSAAATLYTEP